MSISFDVWENLPAAHVYLPKTGFLINMEAVFPRFNDTRLRGWSSEATAHDTC